MAFADVNGASLHFELSGSGSPLVLLHEMGGTLESWDAVVPLVSGHRVLRFDARGAGMSQKIVGGVTLEELVGDLVALLDHVGFDGPVVLAGVAVGAAVALCLAVRHPGRVRGVLAMAPATGVAAERRQATLDLADRFEREGLRARVLERIDHSFPLEYRSDPELFAAFRGRMLGNDPRSYAAWHRMLAGMTLDDALDRVACPVLVVAGDTDQTRPAAVVREVAARIDRARFVEVHSGHVMPVLTPGVVGRLLGDFLAVV